MIRLRTINRWLRRIGLCLVVCEELDEDVAREIGRTSFRLDWIGLPGTARRKAWESKWYA